MGSLSQFIQKLWADGAGYAFNAPLVDAKDVTDMHIEAAERPEASGRYLITGPTIPNAKELYDCVRKKLPWLEIDEVNNDPMHGRHRGPPAGRWERFDSSRAEQFLGRPLR